MVLDKLVSKIPDLSLYLEAIVIVLCSITVTFIGLIIGSLALPLLQVIVIIPFFLKNVWKWRLWRASGLVLLWSLLLTVSVAAASYSIGCSIDHVSRIIKGQSYLSEMIHWIETGEGPEGDPSLFIVPKIIEIGLFSIVTFLTIGIGGLFMGAILLNYMNLYYGTVIYMANGDPNAILFGWPIYAIIRVIGYVFLGTYLSRLIMNIAERKPLNQLFTGTARRLLIYALILIILDFILKATIANTIYQPLLNSIIDQEKLTICKQAIIK